ncbi:uncharacterized protein LOC129809288, partial [Phlebotomus papatasi]|uniref:uncharacterized protein LOC129809288 n=1 Tax=Phlebotomus papatasi TaxID=29031 RepID=UPI002483B24B
MIVPSDKGNKTVVMSKTDYKKKMIEIVSDENTYTLIRTDRTLSAETRNNELVKQLHDGGHIDSITKKVLTTHNSRTPRIYGLPKIHKQGTPLRPIVSCIMAPTYEISKFISNILKPVTNRGGYSVKDSFEFVERVRTITVPEGYVMVSFDVIALFPNIPRNLAIQIIDNMWQTIQSHTSIGKDLFMKILRYCLETSYFVYEDQYYHQIDGMPMGGPLSPVIADLVMDHALTSILNTIPENVLCLTKYVDDIFCLIPHEKVNDTLNAFNGFHHKLQFTVETETDGGIAYLDTYVIRQNQQLETMWYKKPIASDRMLSYHSKHPLQQKISTAIGLIKRVQKLTTTNRANTKNIIFSKLRVNGYPPGLINALWGAHSTSHFDNIPESDQRIDDITYKSLTY